MIKKDRLGRPYRIYKNSPRCPICDNPMRYLYTHIASHRSVWKCLECNEKAVTRGYPEDDDDGDSSKCSIALNISDCCMFFSMPGVNYGNRETRRDTLFLQDHKTKVSGKGYRKQVSTIYALYV